MKKKIKIFIQKPWVQSDSPYYKFLRENPPEGIEYVNAKNFKLIQNKNKLKLNNWIKQNGKKWVRKFFPNLPNIHFTKDSEKYDLIHCAHCLSKNKNKSWVADMEHFGQFWLAPMAQNKHGSKKWILPYILSNNCKKIMPWTEWSKNNILKRFPELKDKIELVYPAVPERKFKKKKTGKIKLLFVGRNFYLKGGEVAIKVVDELSRKYENVEGVIVSDTPSVILKKYSKNKKITFYNLLSQEKLFREIYPSCDIFLYPTFSDTFGFAILEAQSFGLPVITQKTRSTHTLHETIREGETGFIIENLGASGEDRNFNKKIIREIIINTEKLIKSKPLLKKMSKNCLKEIKSGKFSIRKRNEKLKKIYSDALK